MIFAIVAQYANRVKINRVITRIDCILGDIQISINTSDVTILEIPKPCDSCFESIFHAEM